MHTLVHYDDSGDLLSGVFFELRIPLPSYREFFPKETSSGIWSRRNGECVTSVVQTTAKKQYLCSLNSSHVTDIFYSPVGVDLSNSGAEIAYFLPNCEGDEYAVCSERLLKALPRDLFKGCGLVPLDILSCDPVNLEGDVISMIEFTGGKCVRSSEVNIPEPNCCPFCGFEPIVCPVCLNIPVRCPHCNRSVTAIEDKHLGAADVRFLVESPPRAGLILNGDQWDGADFVPGGIGVGFVSRNVVKWMLCEEIWPFWVKAARLDVANLTAENSAALEALRSIDLTPWCME